jgi:Mo-co oxidoreductase dimerisation domain
VTVLGAAYAGEQDVATVGVSVDGGATWFPATFIGPHEPFSWRQWQFIWEPGQAGGYTIMARATDSERRQQPMTAQWNVLGYGNNGVREHGIIVHIR